MILMTSCNTKNNKYSIIYSEEEPLGEISRNLEKIWEEELGLDIKLINGSGSSANLDSVAKGRADFTITENYIPFKQDVSSMLVFFPQVLHIFYSAPETPKSFAELVVGKRVFMGAEGSGSFRFMIKLFEFFKINRSQVQIVDDPFENVDVFAGFNDILEDNNLMGLESFKLYSFDRIDHFGHGSLAEAIALKYPKVHPYVIPEGTYGDITKEAILTLSSDAVLVVRSGIPEEDVYEMIKSAFHHKQEFNDISPLVYKGMDEQFDRTSLTFPLHEGARIYLDRDEPSVFERYAELAGVLFSMGLALWSGIISIKRWQTQRKKDRVDIFYKDLIEIKNEISSIRTTDVGLQKLTVIKNSQNKAFNMLINEELEANESFRIYMELSKETINELKTHLQYIKRRKERVALANSRT
ncbi:MAG: TAXI family TRAP transporter solute-binding subunit [Cyclobacteriaceae bacterium]